MPNELPLISIIIPTLNSAKFLKECLDSVKKQTYQNLEILIIDGKSSDSTVEIIKSYCSNQNWHFFSSKKGVSLQRNIGLDNAKGGYIYFLDSDDYINETFIESLFHYLELNDLDFVTPEIVLARFKNNELQKLETFKPKIRNEISKDNFFIDGYDSCLAGPTKLYRKELINDNRFNTKCAFGEDYLFNYSLIKTKKAKFGICVDAKYYYRKCDGETSVTKRLTKETAYFFKLFNKIIKQLDKTSQNFLDAKKLYKENANIFIEGFIRNKKHIPLNFASTRFYFFINDHSKKRWFYLFPKLYLRFKK